MTTSVNSNAITAYWIKYYLDTPECACCFCGNLGYIDTTDREDGKICFCICPSGQYIREKEQKNGELNE